MIYVQKGKFNIVIFIEKHVHLGDHFVSGRKLVMFQNVVLIVMVVKSYKMLYVKMVI